MIKETFFAEVVVTFMAKKNDELQWKKKEVASRMGH